MDSNIMSHYKNKLQEDKDNKNKKDEVPEEGYFCSYCYTTTQNQPTSRTPSYAANFVNPHGNKEKVEIKDENINPDTEIVKSNSEGKTKSQELNKVPQVPPVEVVEYSIDFNEDEYENTVTNRMLPKLWQKNHEFNQNQGINEKRKQLLGQETITRKQRKNNLPNK